jgi:isopenicillin N synthase-like dioxygenase
LQSNSSLSEGTPMRHPHRSGTEVAIGDQLQAWTAGRLVSTPHRVRADSSTAATVDRYSIALFCFADFYAAIDAGRTLTSGEYSHSKLQATQGAPALACELQRTLQD